ncbi:hypothetical protein CGLO_09590 [Colletotrichum gloeosporioides Cg-14]|jgi:hypothetical protein
MAVRV